jgi:hypothetical protein
MYSTILMTYSRQQSACGTLNQNFRRPIPSAIILPPLPVPRASHCTATSGRCTVCAKSTATMYPPDRPLDHGSRVTVVYSAKGRLPSPAPSPPQTIDTEIPSDCDNLGRSSSDILPTLTEVTFSSQISLYCTVFPRSSVAVSYLLTPRPSTAQ